MKNYKNIAVKGLLTISVMAMLAAVSPAQGRWDNNDRNDRNQGRWSTQSRAFTRTQSGNGTVRFDGRNYDINSVQVSLQSNGRATVRAIRGGDDFVFTGKWSQYGLRRDSAGLILDRVQHGNDSDKANARGRVDLRPGGGFDFVEITGRNRDEKNDLSLRFDTNGRGNDDDYDYPNNGNRSAAGNYMDTEQWGHNNESFQIKYTLDLARNSRQARLVADSTWDRNMPNDDRDTNRHGDILRYLHSGHNVVQTGRWSQNGDNVTITFDRISYGNTSRSKSETMRGRLKGNTIIIDSFDRDFYGRDARLTFERR